MNSCMGGVWPACPGGKRKHGQLASLPAGQTLGRGDNLHISLLLYRIYTEWPDNYAFRDHNNLATQCITNSIPIPHEAKS